VRDAHALPVEPAGAGLSTTASFAQLLSRGRRALRLAR
jgi:hypothetical protein